MSWRKLLEGARKDKIAESQKIKPMLAVSCKEPFDKEGWIYEVKWDGFRTIAIVRDKIARLYSRHQNEFDKFPAIVESLKKLPYDVVLDGEMVVLDETGIPRLEKIKKYSPKNKTGPLIYYVFDILYVDGHDVTGLTLETRKKILEGVLADLNASNVLTSKYLENQGVEFYEKAVAQGVEGVMAKDARSPYLRDTRSSYWQKFKPPQKGKQDKKQPFKPKRRPRHRR